MPELPEVETIARTLREGGREGPPLLGRTLRGAHVLWARTLATSDPPTFAQTLAGQTVRSVGRRGKFLVLGLSRGHSLLIHLRMSGDLRWQPPPPDPQTPPTPAPHDRLILEFTDGWRLCFNDPRKFGRVWLVEHADSVLAELGPEPLDESLSAEAFHRRLSATRRALKPLLMDQRFLAGLGNIYADEALFHANLHPLRPAHTLTFHEASRLLEAIRLVLREGIRRNGASIDWVYRGGDFQHHFAVYGRAGQPCRRCGTPIQRLRIAQRSAHFCPQCQPPFETSSGALLSQIGEVGV